MGSVKAVLQRVKKWAKLEIKRWRVEQHRCPECGKKVKTDIYCDHCMKLLKGAFRGTQG